jgi:hypothetical protein
VGEVRREEPGRVRTAVAVAVAVVVVASLSPRRCPPCEQRKARRWRALLGYVPRATSSQTREASERKGAGGWRSSGTPLVRSGKAKGRWSRGSGASWLDCCCWVGVGSGGEEARRISRVAEYWAREALLRQRK